jgi:cytochrome c-type biogenesis protein
MAPVLGVVFETAQTSYLLAVIFLLAFGIGHCSVIVGAGTLTGKVQRYLNWSEGSRIIFWIKKICGVLVITGGIYLIFTTR